MTINVSKALLKAKSLARRGDLNAATLLYKSILNHYPQNKKAQEGLAAVTVGTVPKRSATASTDRDDVEKLISLYTTGRLKEALSVGLPLVAKYPDDAKLHNLFGAICTGLGNTDKAISSFIRAIELVPDFSDAYTNLGAAYNAAGHNEVAIDCYLKAIEFEPQDSDNYYNLGNTLRDMGKQERAVSAFLKAIELNPGHVAALNNLGICLIRLGRYREASEIFKQSIEIEPEYAEAHVNLGNAMRTLRYYDKAIASYDRAIELRPDHAESYNNQGMIFEEMGDAEKAVACLEVAVKLAPDSLNCRANLLFLQSSLCDWSSKYCSVNFSAPGSTEDCINPFSLIHLQDTPELTRSCAELFSVNYGAVEKIAINRNVRIKSGSEPIRIGYFSADFHNHPVMHLFVRTLELSRREMFDQQAFSFGPHSKGPMRQRVVQAVSKFHDVRNMGDKEVAQLAQAEGIDIAVDLTGYTRNSRCGIFSYRAAPIQVNYLGYPGTSGAAWMDYIIADPVIIPKEMAQHYSEKVIYLPNSYMPSDNTREIAARPLSRTEEGLPEKGFVFCCFNKPSKIRPQEFNIWMRLLRQVDHSVLWLKIGNDKAKENLRQEATKHGIDPSRLVFASYVDELADHLARHRLADLFLDTFNHNAHTTANDALWAGLPIITKLGAGFASRVTSSLLKAANLPELITHSSEEYEELALELARNSAKLSALRSKLEANLVNTPLFDSEGFSRDLESAYELVYDRYLRGDQPGVIHV